MEFLSPKAFHGKHFQSMLRKYHLLFCFFLPIINIKADFSAIRNALSCGFFYTILFIYSFLCCFYILIYVVKLFIRSLKSIKTYILFLYNTFILWFVFILLTLF